MFYATFVADGGEVSAYCNPMKFPEAKLLCIKLDGQLLENKSDIMMLLKHKLYNFHGCYQFWLCPKGK